MAVIDRYREFYEHEKWADGKMLAMLESVPTDARGDDRFARALRLAAHLASCREIWLAFMKGLPQPCPWWEEDVALESLAPRFAAMEADWTAFLAGLDDNDLAQNFSFVDGGETWSVLLEHQIMQLVGHAPYHRGQIALVVDELGGQTIDTDFIFWKYEWDE